MSDDLLDRLRHRPVVTDSVTLAIDPNDALRLGEARSAVDKANRDLTRTEAALERAKGSQRAQDDAAAAAEALAAAEAALAALAASLVTFTVHVKAIGADRYQQLLILHPPTTKQVREASELANDKNARPAYNEDTFPQVFLSEAISRVTFSDTDDAIAGVTEAQALDLWRSIRSATDQHLLMQTAALLNQVGSQVGDLGKG